MIVLGTQRLALGSHRALVRRFWRYPVGSVLINVRTRRTLRIRVDDYVPPAQFWEANGRSVGSTIPAWWGA
jgi:hypothetical protein